MIEALIKGKLSHDLENMEDILTSNVFGLIKYLPPKLLLFPFLRVAKTIKGDLPLKTISDDLSSQLIFWPFLNETNCRPCEPDLLLNLSDGTGKTRYSILIEAKFHSGKSSYPDSSDFPNDQLAREYDNLQKYSENVGSIPVLIYLTADYGMPRGSIEESISEYTAKRGNTPTIAWISWQHLNSIIGDTTGHDQYGEMIRDISSLLTKLGLDLFKGAPALEPYNLRWKFKKMWQFGIKAPVISWSFVKEWDYKLFVHRIGWKYARHWNWALIETNIIWRFTHESR
ncbi:MAG: hypothetical protein DRI92_05055 [Aquificota bacterium]|nr:MAG: hypothetical protein DRI92_05055 [Aquificota bacterium]